MNKLKTLILATALVALFCSPGFAAMDCTGDNGDIYVGGEGGKGDKTAVITCTFDDDPGTAVDTIPAAIMRQLDDMYLYTIVTKPGSTAPTDQSDMAITDCNSVTILSASNNGQDVIDATSTVGPFYAENGAGDNFYPKIHEWCAWTVTVTNQEVDTGAIFIMYFEAVK